jgi:3-methyladenine DNA glycosylase AlkD
MTHALGKAIRRALKARADPARAPQMQRYMKSAMPYYGVSAPVQKQVWREVFAAHPLESCAELREAALDLWRSARRREERYAAIAVTDLRRHDCCQTMDALPMYEEMIVTGAWWDYVDVIASHHLGAVLRHDPKRMKPLMRRWARTPDSLWQRRAAILCQLRFKDDTDLGLLYDCIEPNLADRQFFIRKAIGWALRQYAWIDAREVQRYVAANRSRLSPLSIREALKNSHGRPEGRASTTPDVNDQGAGRDRRL